MLKGKNILLGVTGGIACYKACDIVSRLVKLGASVDVVMTHNATQLISPKTFESLSHRQVYTDTFERIQSYNVEHIALAQRADIAVIAPCTFNVIGKLASGIADDMLTTTFAACRAQKIICPAMNTAMYENAVLKDNLSRLTEYGYRVIEPISGHLACGDVGVGKMSEPSDIVDCIVKVLCGERDMTGKRVLITGGGTEESIDRVRVITNHSSGKMALGLIEECMERGAEVTVVAGNMSVQLPRGVNVISVKSTQDMYDAVLDNSAGQDYFIMAAAPADYRPRTVSEHKIKSEQLTLELVKNPDIAAAVGKVKGNAKLIVFSAETENLIENATAKLIKKGADMVVANDVTKEGAGFNTDTNIVTIITAGGNQYDYDVMTKRKVAHEIVERMLALR